MKVLDLKISYKIVKLHMVIGVENKERVKLTLASTVLCSSGGTTPLGSSDISCLNAMEGGGIGLADDAVDAGSFFTGVALAAAAAAAAGVAAFFFSVLGMVNLD